MNSSVLKRMLVLVLIVLVSCGMVGCVSSSAEKDKNESCSSAEESSSAVPDTSENVFYAEVTDTDSIFGGITVKPEGNVLPPELVVQSDNMPAVSVGDRIRVVHYGQITMSLPGQVFAASVTIAE